MTRGDRRRWSSAAALLLAALAACRAAPSAAGLLSSEAVVLETPVLEQDALYECGLVALSALCAYHGVAIPPLERAQLAQTAAEREGLSGEELRAALERLGFESFVFAGTLDREATGLLHHVDLARPLIVMTRERGTNHFSLFIGYDAERESVALLDPRRGRVVLPTAVFARLWEAAERFTLLAVPAG